MATQRKASSRPRDYRAEYAKRNDRARAEGYRSYNRKRTASEKIKETLEEGGLVKDLFDDLAEDERETSLLWRLFRLQYQRGATQA